MPIAAFVKMTAKPGHGDELQSRLEEILQDVRTEPGNLLAVTLRDPDTPDAVYEFAIYRDQDAIYAHRAADHSVEKGPWVQEMFGAPMSPHMLQTCDWPADKKVA